MYIKVEIFQINNKSFLKFLYICSDFAKLQKFMSIIKNISPKNKLLISVIVFSIIISFLIFYFNSKNKTSVAVFENLSNVEIKTSQLWINLDEYENANHNDDFYEFGEDYYSKNFFETFKSLKISYLKLNEIFVGKNSPKLNQLLGLSKNYNKIEKIFTLIVQNDTKIGNEKTGLFSELINSRINTKQKIELLTGENVKPIFYNSSEIVDKLISTKNAQYKFDFNSDIKNIKLVLQNDSNLYYKEILNSLNEYQNSFNVICDLITENGSNNKGGLINDLNNNIAQTISILLEFNKNDSEIIKQTFPDYSNYISILSIFSSLIFISLVFYILSPNQKNIISLKKNSENILTENYNFIDIEGNTELKEVNINIKNTRKAILKTQKIISKIEKVSLKKIKESFPKNEIPVNELLNLKNVFDKIKENAEKTKQIKELEEIKNKQIAIFSKILRQRYDSLEELAMKTIIELVEYTKSQIAGLYIVKTDKENLKYLDLIASFAFNEKRILKNKFNFGESLIGACAIEKNTFYFENIDKEYVTIVSGMGETKPDNLLIIPILLGEEIFGVLEMASLNKYTKEDISFIETVGQDIAASISRFVV